VINDFEAEVLEAAPMLVQYMQMTGFVLSFELRDPSLVGPQKFT
jgi:hypothetical protein